MSGRPLRVCAVIQGFRPAVGGAELQLERLLPLLAERGVEMTVLTRAQPGCPRSELVAGAVVRRTRIAGTSPAASLAFVAGSFCHLLRNRRRLDLVHAHGGLSEGTVAVLASGLGLPGLVKILRAGPYGDLRTLEQRPLGRLRLRALVRRLSFVSVSPEVREELLAAGVPPGRIADVPNGVDGAVFRPAGPDERYRLRDALGLPRGPLAAAVGRLHPVKRFDLAVQAVAAAEGARLLVVGDGPDRQRLERLAAELGAGDRILFTGLARDVAGYLRATDVFLLPSAGEGLSNALLEAMACGLPCAAAPAAGVHELLGEGRGLVVEEATPAAWADALRRLLDDPGDTGVRAAAYVRERHSLEATAGGLVRAYRRAAGVS